MAVGWHDAELLAAEMDTPLLPHQAPEALRDLSGDALRAVVTAAANALVASEDTSPPDALGGEAFAAASCVLVRCARDNVNGVDVMTQYRHILLDCGLQDDEELTARLLPLLVEHVSKIQAVLRASSFDFAHVVDVSWRLDYVLRSSSSGKIHEPIYYVQLKVQPPQGGVRDLVFSCSVEELRDLVYRLQDATNTMEKIARVASTSAPRRDQTASA